MDAYENEAVSGQEDHTLQSGMAFAEVEQVKVKDLKSQLDQHEDGCHLRLRGRMLEVLDEKRRVVGGIPIRVSKEERRWLGLQAEMRRRRLVEARNAPG